MTLTYSFDPSHLFVSFSNIFFILSILNLLYITFTYQFMMDFLKKAQESLGSNNNQQAGGQQPQGGAAPAQNNTGNEDYGDKGTSSYHSPLFSHGTRVGRRNLLNEKERNEADLVLETGLDFIEKKSGHTLGRDTNEKITDGARGLYEKATGYVSLGRESPNNCNLILCCILEARSILSIRTNGLGLQEQG